MPRYFTEDHEWIDVDGGTGTVGITDYAQEQLGDITFVELPAVGASVNQGDAACVIESVKAASEVYSPVSGEVTEVNDELEGAPELVNSSADSEGWFYRLTLADPGQLGALMDEAAYKTYCKGL